MKVDFQGVKSYISIIGESILISSYAQETMSLCTTVRCLLGRTDTKFAVSHPTKAEFNTESCLL